MSDTVLLCLIVLLLVYFLSPLWPCQIIYNECFNWDHFKNSPLCEDLSRHSEVAFQSINWPALISFYEIIKNLICTLKLCFCVADSVLLGPRLTKGMLFSLWSVCPPSHPHLLSSQVFLLLTHPVSHLRAQIHSASQESGYLTHQKTFIIGYHIYQFNTC